jgi:hypothetical protein
MAKVRKEDGANYGRLHLASALGFPSSIPTPTNRRTPRSPSNEARAKKKQKAAQSAAF